MRQEAWILTSAIQHDSSLDHRRREHLYRELISAILESRAKDSAEEPTELSSVLLGAQLSIRTPAPFPPLGSQPGSQTTELRTYRGPGTSHLAIVRHAAVRQILDPASGGRAALVPNANPVRDRVGDLFATGKVVRSRRVHQSTAAASPTPANSAAAPVTLYAAARNVPLPHRR